MTAGIIKIGIAISILAASCAGASHKPASHPTRRPVPVEDPARWDPTVYCATIQPPADAWCLAHGYGDGRVHALK